MNLVNPDYKHIYRSSLLNCVPMLLKCYKMLKIVDVLFLIPLIHLTDSLQLRGRNTRCIDNTKCVPISSCSTPDDIVYPCNENQTYVCCSPEHLIDQKNISTVVSRTSAFPRTCGIVTTTDRITGGEIALLGQFPWMALLGYTQRNIDIVQFLCAGSLITHHHILTAAHCISIDSRLKLVVVRLGELNLETEQDCENAGDEQICGDPYQDVSIDRTIPHPNFNKKTLEADIALIKLKRRILFSDYIQPICIPFEKDINQKLVINEKLIVSGWGKTDSANIGGSSSLQWTKVTLWDQIRCNSSIPPRIRPVRNSQLCANGLKKQDACKGDSGGPLVNQTVIDNDFRSYQIGIVSFASAQICGNPELPTVYTRVEYYLRWIVDNVV